MEWLRERGFTAAEFARQIGVEKSQPSRWKKGQMPQEATLKKIADGLEIPAEQLFYHPDDVWFSTFMKDRDVEERERIMSTLVSAFPPLNDMPERGKPLKKRDIPRKKGRENNITE